LAKSSLSAWSVSESVDMQKKNVMEDTISYLMPKIVYLSHTYLSQPHHTPTKVNSGGFQAGAWHNTERCYTTHLAQIS